MTGLPPSLWQAKVRLGDTFLRSLREHPVPVREEAVKAIGTRSMAIDISVWLAYRLHALTERTAISWLSLHTQFGSGFKRVRQFKATFLDWLAMAVAVYPEAHVDAEEGLILYPFPRAG